MLYPQRASNAFAYDGGYIIQDSLDVGPGYWLKFYGAVSVSMTGSIVLADTIEVKQRWNMIGSVSAPIAVTSIRSVPPAIVTSQVFGYSGAYFIADTIYPGRGYWVKTTQEGLLFLTSGPLTPEAKLIRIIPTEELPPNPPDENMLTSEDKPKEYEAQPIVSQSV